jgi:hypothetical protein
LSHVNGQNLSIHRELYGHPTPLEMTAVPTHPLAISVPISFAQSESRGAMLLCWNSQGVAIAQNCPTGMLPRLGASARLSVNFHRNGRSLMRVRAILWTVMMAYTGFLLTGQGLRTFNSLSITEGLLGALTGFLLAIMFILRERRRRRGAFITYPIADILPWASPADRRSHPNDKN